MESYHIDDTLTLLLGTLLLISVTPWSVIGNPLFKKNRKLFFFLLRMAHQTILGFDRLKITKAT